MEQLRKRFDLLYTECKKKATVISGQQLLESLKNLAVI
jgi:hypothetical protein